MHTHTCCACVCVSGRARICVFTLQHVHMFLMCNDQFFQPWTHPHDMLLWLNIPIRTVYIYIYICLSCAVPFLIYMSICIHIRIREKKCPLSCMVHPPSRSNHPGVVASLAPPSHGCRTFRWCPLSWYAWPCRYVVALTVWLEPELKSSWTGQN